MTSSLMIEENPVLLLLRYHLLPDLVRELVTDDAIASIVCTPEEIEQLYQQIHTQSQEQTSNPEQAIKSAIRSLKIEKFKQLKWGDQIELYFHQRQNLLTKVIYSLIRTQDPELINELYFRIQEQEQSFAELARLYSQGSEAQTDGLVGPVELETYHPAFAHLLATSPAGELQPPMQLDCWWIILRVEKRIPAQLDAAMQQRLLNELFEKWREQRFDRIIQQGGIRVIASSEAGSDRFSPSR
jgi:parvulin-like peptidyl-prolyl isomerase